MDPVKLRMSSRIAVLKRASHAAFALPIRHGHSVGALPFHSRVRALSSSAPSKMASSISSPRYSAGSDPDTAGKALTPLLTSGGGRWTLTGNGEGLERTFKFKTFARTWVCLVLPFSTALSLCVLYFGISSIEACSGRVSHPSSLTLCPSPPVVLHSLFDIHIDDLPI